MSEVKWKRLLRSPALPAILAMSSCDGPQPVDMPVIAIDPHSLTVLSPAQGALGDVTDVLVVDDTIWALTASAPYVHGFGPTGKLTARFGSAGEGPGEFRFPSAIWPGGVSGSLTVWDSGSFAALTFSTGGALLSFSRTPLRGAIRSDIGTVTFGDPLRAVPVPGGLAVVLYDSGVNHGSDLWNGRLVHIPYYGGHPSVLLDFATGSTGNRAPPHHQPHGVRNPLGTVVRMDELPFLIPMPGSSSWWTQFETSMPRSPFLGIRNRWAPTPALHT